MKRFISIFLSLSLLLTMCFGFGFGAKAASVSTDGNYEYEVLDDQTAMITEYLGFEEEVKIPHELDGHIVTKIDAMSFIGRDFITSLFLPSGLKYIGKRAFHDCRILSKVYFPDGLETIDDYAFYMCSKLTDITLPKGLKEIGYQAFYGTEWLNSVAVDAGNDCFTAEDGVLFNSDKTALILYPSRVNTKSYIIPDTVERIVDSAFASAKYLQNITIPKSVKTIEDNAFENCSALKKVNYASTQYKWSQIEIGENNDALTKAELIYSGPCEVHTPDRIELVKEPTCTEDGEQRYTCTECGELVTGSLPKLGHTPADEVAVAPTCTENGKSAYTYCTVCGEILEQASEIPALGHNYQEEITKQATCTEDGEKTFTCTRCGETITETIEAAGHTAVIDEAVPATYFESGKTEGSHCSVCGEILVLQNVVPRLKLARPARPKAQAKTKKFVISWNRNANATGYQIQYSTSKKFSKKTTKTVTVKRNTKAKRTVKNLKSKKRYYVRVRAYKRSGSKTVYSSWSKIRRIKTK